METIFPKKFNRGDVVRVIAPATSAKCFDDELIRLATKNIEDLGLTVSFSEHLYEVDMFNSSTAKSRVSDLHEAFLDKCVKGILTFIGGFNSNQMLRLIDWDIIKNNPKIFCGYSDITVLANAIYSKTDLVTYSGLHFSSFGQKKLQEYNIDYFKKCLFSNESFSIEPSKQWSDDRAQKWQSEDRALENNDGWWVINEGYAKGKSIGGNIASLRLLYGTEYMPSLNDTILFVEDDHYTTNDIAEFDRNLQSLIHQQDFSAVRALIIGRFQIGSKMTQEILIEIIKSKKELNSIPVVANVDFGHTDPLVTFPIGGEVEIMLEGDNKKLEIINH